MADDAESGKWLKVKARMPNNQKVMGLSDAAFRLHISVSCWCCDEVNDGRFKANVPSGMPRAPQGKKLTDAIKEIVDAELWHPTEDGYEINDFLKYNMSRAQWEAKKAAGKLGGQRSGVVRRGRSEAPAEAPASAPASAPAEHENEYDQRSKQPPPAKDLTATPRAAPVRAAAASDLGEFREGIQAFSNAVAKAWHPIRLGSFESDPLVRLLVAELKNGLSVEGVADAGEHIGAWLSRPAPNGAPRSLSMVTYPVLRRALEDSQVAFLERAAAEARQRQRLLELRDSCAPRKATPPALDLRETLAHIRAATEAVGG